MKFVTFNSKSNDWMTASNVGRSKMHQNLCTTSQRRETSSLQTPLHTSCTTNPTLLSQEDLPIIKPSSTITTSEAIFVKLLPQRLDNTSDYRLLAESAFWRSAFCPFV